MEALRNLEGVQSMLQMMQSRGISRSSSTDDHRDTSDRFLAEFFLFLMQPCGELDMDKKCHLISEYMPKVSAEFLEEASVWLNEEGCRSCSVLKPSTPIGEDMMDISRLQYGSIDMAMVGLDAMERANSTLGDFCRSYFMFHEMDDKLPQSLFQYLPILSFTESYIYQLDGLNEEIMQIPADGFNTSAGISQEEHQSWIISFLGAFKTDPFRALVLQLEGRGVLTERIREELAYGEEYWSLERKLCHALLSSEEILIADVMRAIHLKSFDYRVLNLLLYHLRGKKVNELHMEFLSVSEFLVEVSDDLFDYEDDVLENNFNILRMFVRIYGASNAPLMLAKCIAEAEEKHNNLLRSLDPELSLKYQRRCEEATKEGGKISGYALGTWTMPPVISDEEAYRSKLLNTKL